MKWLTTLWQVKSRLLVWREAFVYELRFACGLLWESKTDLHRHTSTFVLSYLRCDAAGFIPLLGGNLFSVRLSCYYSVISAICSLGVSVLYSVSRGSCAWPSGLWRVPLCVFPPPNPKRPIRVTALTRLASIS